ncbi:MAG: 2Fe-2S iron-sulfur cluster-binding protein [Terriglobia bacterium]
MPKKVSIRLVPLGETLEVHQGTPLQDVLFKYGVEFPCGGMGVCRGCRVRVLNGNIPVTLEMEEILTEEEIAVGWRLACQACADTPLEVEVAQWETPILSDDTQFEFEPDEGLGVAIDLGTTTLVVQLLDLSTGQVLAVRTALNPQAAHGADLMSRVEYALAEKNPGEGTLTREIHQCLHQLVLETFELARVAPDNLHLVMIVGNTVMHHLFCGVDVEHLFRMSPLNQSTTGSSVSPPNSWAGPDVENPGFISFPVWAGL